METDDPCIVLTHHAPMFSVPEDKLCCDPMYVDSPCVNAFHNDLTRLIKSPICAWIYGHTHYANCFEENGVIIATNQLGYQEEERIINFSPYSHLNLERLWTDSL